jgi:branched-chain amino acid transport system ATP-binding protein
MLTVVDLVAGYGPVTVLHQVGITVNAGEAIAIVGANGAGKTTLLRTLSGLLKSQSGRVQLNDRDVTGFPTHALARLGLCHVPEGRRIFAPMDVRSNLELGSFCRRDRSRGSIAEDLERVFALFPRLADRQWQTAGTLSGGEQQMLAIGRALMGRPRLLLLDEPSLGLAPQVFLEIFEVIGRIRAEGVAIVLVEQNVRLALRSTQYAFVLQTGRVVLRGPSSEVLQSELIRTAYLGGAVKANAG